MSETNQPSHEANAPQLELTDNQRQKLESLKRAFMKLASSYLAQFEIKEEAKIYPLADEINLKVEANQKMMRDIMITIYSFMLIQTKGAQFNLGHFYSNTLTALDPEDEFIDANWHINFLNDVTHFLARRTTDLTASDIITSVDICELVDELSNKVDGVLSKIR